MNAIGARKSETTGFNAGDSDGASAIDGETPGQTEMGRWQDFPPVDGVGGGGGIPAAEVRDTGSTDCGSAQPDARSSPIALRARPQVWDEARTRRLFAMREAGASRHEIADALGVTPSAVKGRLRTLGGEYKAPRPTIWNDENTQLLRKLWDEGWSASLIARKIPGATRNSVIGKADREELSDRKPRQGQRLRSREPKSQARSRPARMKASKKRLLPFVPPPPKAMPVAPLNVPIWDLEPHHCREVTGHDMTALYCGHPQVRHGFCAWHLSINYQTVAVRNLVNLARAA